jgi:hypothetical protein
MLQPASKYRLQTPQTIITIQLLTGSNGEAEVKHPAGDLCELILGQFALARCSDVVRSVVGLAHELLLSALVAAVKRFTGGTKSQAGE